MLDSDDIDAPPARTGRRAVAVHVATADNPTAVIRNVTNLYAGLGEDTEIEVVTHGPGLDLGLAAGPVAAEILDLVAAGVRIRACRNSLRSRAIGPEALVPGVDIVPSGVAHLVELQWAGFAYVRL